MKKVLITGKNSYLGSFVKQELNRYPQKYQVQELDMMNPNWQSFDFSGFDFHIFLHLIIFHYVKHIHHFFFTFILVYNLSIIFFIFSPGVHGIGTSLPL